MKLTVVLFLAIVLMSYDPALAKKKINFGKLFDKNKKPKPKDDFKSKPGLFNQGSVHKQDTPGSPYNYRPQPGQGGIGEHGGHGGYPGHGGYGGYINRNPNNPILSPHFGGSYGGYDPGRGSPYSRTVQAMGYVPSEKSKGFGRSAVMAAAGGAVAGMALGYGLGRFPRPQFHSPEEEYYYNYYMYRRYGLKPPDDKDFSRHHKVLHLSFIDFMNLCMKNIDLLPSTKKSKLTTTTTTTTTSAVTTTTSVSPSVSSNMTRNMTVHNSTSKGPTVSANPNPPEAGPGNSSGAPAVSYTNADEDDDDTVSVVEIGYPALIKQLKVRKCLERYIVYREDILRKITTPNPKGSGQCWECSQWLLLVLSVVIVMVA